MKTLLLDIENSPNLAHVWGLFDQTVSLAQLMESMRVICFAYKWHGDNKVGFFSDHHNGHDTMIAAAHSLVDQADVVVHYNGKRHDMPHLRTEWLRAGLTAPSPVQEVDLFTTVRSQFKFPSMKLDYVLKELGLPGKVKNSGHQLWVNCMAGDEKAWREMKRYNMQDVRAMEPLYDLLLSWIRQHPTVPLFNPDTGEQLCPRCGSADLRREGWSYTSLARFQRYCCVACGKWSRSGKADARVDLRAA